MKRDVVCSKSVRWLKMAKDKTRHVAYQAEWPEDGQSLDVGESQLDEAENDDDDIETVPAISQVSVET